MEHPPGQRLTRISVDNEPNDNFQGTLAAGHDVTGVFGVADDGGYVYFSVTQGQIVAGGPIGPTGGPVGEERIFVWHNGTVHEVGAVNGQAELHQMTGSPDGWSSVSAKWSRVTPDGTHLAFVTQGTNELLSLYGVENYDHGEKCPKAQYNSTCLEVYVYDAQANDGHGVLKCASCNQTGARATGDADFYTFFTVGILGSGSTHLPHVLSDDGRYVFFNSEERLVPADRNSAVDAYEFNTETNQVAMLSSGSGPEDAIFLDASPDGHDAVFTTRERLRSTDRDDSRDLYDARIDGVPDPGALPAREPCTGEACRSPRRASKNLNVPGSSVRRRSDERSGGRHLAIFNVTPLNDHQLRRWALGGHISLSASVSEPGAIRVRVRARMNGRWQTVEVVSKTIRDAGKVRVRLSLAKALRRALGRKGHVRLILTTTYSRVARAQTMRVRLSRVS